MRENNEPDVSHTNVLAHLLYSETKVFKNLMRDIIEKENSFGGKFVWRVGETTSNSRSVLHALSDI